jgi:hypothetical protein
MPQLKQTSPGQQRIDRLRWVEGICLVSYGLRIGIRVNRPEVMAQLLAYLPPGWKPAPSPLVDHLYSLKVADAGRSPDRPDRHLLYAGPTRQARARALEEILEALESELQLLIAETAPRRVFVHAGVVGWRGRAVIIPGRSLSGKSRLVAALVRAGATYYSDEYAVLDARGRVYPYPRRLSLREPGGGRRRCPPDELGGRAGSAPLPVGWIIITRYQAEASWRPRTVSSRRAAMALMANAVPALRRPAAVMSSLAQAVSTAMTLQGIRGETEQMVEALLIRLEQSVLLDSPGRHRAGKEITG